MLPKTKSYAISFYKKATIYGGIYSSATTTDNNNMDIALHISNCDRRITEIQIEDLQAALDGKLMDEHWGEVMGSQLEIFCQEKTVQVGYTNRRIPIEDFRQLLEEWLEFIG